VAITPLDHLLQLADPQGCKLINLPRRIWVFGGPFRANLSDSSISLRDSFWKQSLTLHPSPPWLKEIDRPEDHEGWWAFSGYSDLLEFERDSCYLAQATVLFAESPGSYAELGALAIDSSILPRLLVVVQSKYLKEGQRQSFLHLGPLKRVKGHEGMCVVGTDSPVDLPSEDFDAVIETITKRLPTQRSTEKLNIDNPTHRLLLLADLTDLLLVSKTAELQAALRHFGADVDEAQLLKSLKLLAFFRLVRNEQYGNNEDFWLSHKSSEAPWIDYTANPDARFDRSRFKVAAITTIDSRPHHKAVFRRQP